MPHSRSWIMELHLEANNNNASNNKLATLSPIVSLEDSPNGSTLTSDSEGIRDDIPQISDSSDTTTSSSLSNSSSDDSLQVNMLLRSSGPNNIPKPVTDDDKPFYQNDGVDDFSSKALFRLEEAVDESPSSQLSDVTHEYLVTSPSSPTQSPPAQVMQRSPGVYDPDRIPTSIFSGPITPTDWSVTSTESLFSIHIGNSSFSKDRASKTSTELPRLEELHSAKELSEEACQSGEVYNSGELYQTGDVKKSDLYQFEECYKSSELIELDEHVRSKKFVPVNKGTEDSTEESAVGTRKARANDKINTNLRGPRDSSVVHQLDKSQAVFSKKKKSSCLHCQCSDCYETIFCCKLSSCFTCSACSCKWPSCSGCSCKWLSCSGCSCKWLSCSGCSCKWLSCSGCSCKWFSWPSCSSSCLSCQGCCQPCCDYKCLNWSSCAWCSCWKSKPKKPCYGSTYNFLKRISKGPKCSIIIIHQASFKGGTLLFLHMLLFIVLLLLMLDNKLCFSYTHVLNCFCKGPLDSQRNLEFGPSLICVL